MFNLKRKENTNVRGNDFEKLSLLVKKAIGHNTIPEFANRNGIPNYAKKIYEIINKKITTYPELWLLQKIANGSELRVSFDELRIACNYNTNNDNINLKDIKPFWGGIYWCDFGDYIDSVTGGIHPAVITQNNWGNEFGTITWAAPLTSKLGKSNQPTHVKIDKKYGLEKNSEIIIEQMRVITKRNLLIDGHVNFICECPEDIMKQVSVAIMKQAGMVHTKARESTVSRFLDKLNEYVNKEIIFRNNNQITTQQKEVAI